MRLTPAQWRSVVVGSQRKREREVLGGHDMVVVVCVLGCSDMRMERRKRVRCMLERLGLGVCIARW